MAAIIVGACGITTSAAIGRLHQDGLGSILSAVKAPASWVLKIDDKANGATFDAPLSANARYVRAEWVGGHEMVIQAYDYQSNGKLIFPPDNPHSESRSGVVIP
jgi:hypothetical protein